MASIRFPILPQPTSRHGSNPTIASPLQISFPAYPTSASAPGSPPLHPTPSRASRSMDQRTRVRGESRSSSVPSALSIPKQLSGRNSPSLNDCRRSVKHLTCFWWKEKGYCRYSEEECLYAHHDTGYYTNPPRQVVPGEPAKAGRSLERALKNLALNSSHKSSRSASTFGGSRPATPGFEMTSISTPSTAHVDQQVLSDSAFLRKLVEQSAREKSIMITTIESLQSEKQTLQTTVDGLKTEKEQLINEHGVLRGVIDQLQQQRSPKNPYGAIGSRQSFTQPFSTASPCKKGGNATEIQKQANEEGMAEQTQLRGLFRNLGPTF